MSSSHLPTKYTFGNARSEHSNHETRDMSGPAVRPSRELALRNSMSRCSAASPFTVTAFRMSRPRRTKWAAKDGDIELSHELRIAERMDTRGSYENIPSVASKPDAPACSWHQKAAASPTLPSREAAGCCTASLDGAMLPPARLGIAPCWRNISDASRIWRVTAASPRWWVTRSHALPVRRGSWRASWWRSCWGVATVCMRRSARSPTPSATPASSTFPVRTSLFCEPSPCSSSHAAGMTCRGASAHSSSSVGTYSCALRRRRSPSSRRTCLTRAPSTRASRSSLGPGLGLGFSASPARAASSTRHRPSSPATSPTPIESSSLAPRPHTVRPTAWPAGPAQANRGTRVPGSGTCRPARHAPEEPCMHASRRLSSAALHCVHCRLRRSTAPATSSAR
eukprot:scaffold6934_cov66-Phaeocystis_antarctica.AAC.3